MKKMKMMIALVMVVAFIGMAGPAGAQFVAAPTNWIAGYSFDGTNMSIPIAALNYLTAGQCSASTGDIRQIVFAMQETVYQKWISIPTTNRSGRINVSRTSSVYTNRISYTYSYQADTVPSTLYVMPE